MKILLFIIFISFISVSDDIAPSDVITIAQVNGKDTIETSSGLKYIVIEKRDGKKAIEGSTVKVHYTGYFEDGKVFDSSTKKPFKFKLGAGMVIPGWDEGIALMRVGDKFRLIIPYQLAYGEQGIPPDIPPKTRLIFDVELVDVK